MAKKKVNAMDNLRKQAKTGAKQNRTERRQKSMKQYNRTEMNSSDKAYISGNLKKVASNRVYGYNEGIKKGEIQKGSDNDWLRESLVRKSPNKVVKNNSWDAITPRQSSPKQKYNIMSSANKNAKKFSDNLNTFTFDGLKTAKSNQRKGKKISNTLEYIKGGAKDLIVDPLVDVMKGVDRLSSAGWGATLGALENAENMMKGYKTEKGLMAKNWNASMDESNRTGWGKGSADFLDEKDSRMLDKDIAWNKSKGYHKVAKELEETKKNASKKNAIAGFGMDILEPLDFGGKVVDLMKGASKFTAKSGKELLKGTADLSTAIKSKHLDDVFFSSKPLEDLKLFDDSGANKIHKQLDNAYSTSKANDVKKIVKQKVATSSQKPFLASFLDDLDNGKPLVEKQLKMDGRTLNKKYTQTKDGYIPQVSRVDEVVDSVEKIGNNKSKQMNMFGKNGSTKAYEKSIDMVSKNKPYDDIIAKYENNPKELQNYLDNLDDMNIEDKIYDRLKKTKPELYNKLVGDSDVISDIVFDDSSIKRGFDGIKTKADEKYLNTPNAREFKSTTQDPTKSNYEEIFKYNPKINKSSFASKIDKYVDKLTDLDKNTLNKISNALTNIKNSDIPSYKKVDMLNKYFFEGKPIIRTNTPNRSLNNFIDYIVDASNMNNKASGVETVLKGKYFAPTMTDVLFEQKMSDIASYLGVNSKADITQPLRELERIKKEVRPLTQDEYKTFLELRKKEEQWNTLYSKVKEMYDGYDEYARNVYGKENPLKGYEEVVNEYADSKRAKKLTVHDIEQEVLDELNELNITDLTQKEISDLVDARAKEYYDELSDVKTNEHIQQREATHVYNQKKGMHELSQSPRVEQANLNKVGETSTELSSQIKSIRKQLNLPKIEVPKAKIKLTGKQKLRDLPPVQDNLKALRRTIEQEVEYMFKNQNAYKGLEGAFKQIKTDYVKNLRQLGVPDDKYFHKVTALQKELTEMFNKIDPKVLRGEVTDDVVKELGSHIKNTSNNTNRYKPKSDKEIFENKLSPLVKMDLQKLARRISEVFDDIDNTVINKLDDISPLELIEDVKPELTKVGNPLDDINSFEAFNEAENVREFEKLTEALNNKPTKVKSQKPSIEEIDKILARYSDVGTVSKSKEPPTSILKNSKYDEDGVLIGSFEPAEGVSHQVSRQADKLKNTNPTFYDKIDDVIEEPPMNKKEMKKAINEENFAKGEEEFYGRSLNEYEKGNKYRFPKSFDEFKEWLNDGKNMKYQENELYDAYKSWLNTWKKGMTIYNPGWHVQNFFQNKGQNYLALGMDAFTPQTDARNMLRQIKGKGDKAQGFGGYSAKELMDFAVNNGVVYGLGEDVRTSRGIFPKLEAQIDNSKLMQKLGESEQTARLHHFLIQIKRGKTPEQALKSVNDTLFDYSKKNKADQVISDFIDPFWTFHKNNAKLMAKTAMENPGKLVKINRGVSGLENGITDENKHKDEYGRIQSSKSFIDEVNGDRYDYMYANQLFPEFADGIDITKETNLNPILRLANQLSKGEGNFGNKIVDENPEWGEISKSQALKEIALDLNPFANQLIKTMDKTSERQKKTDDGKQSQETTDKQVLLDWLKLITGNKGNYYRNY